MRFGGRGARREAGSEGYAEKYRAVVDEGYLKDEPVGQRWGKVEPALWGRRRSHTPTAPRCLRTARYGRSGRDPRRTSRVLSGGTEGSDSISASETRSGALEVVGRLGSTGGAAKVASPEAWRPSGSGKP